MATITQGPPTSIGPVNNTKKLRHKASKPIITWLSKKLGGSHAQRPPKPALSVANVNTDSADPSSTVRGRSLSLQVPPTNEPAARTVVLNDDQDLPSPSAARSMFSERNSLTADSMWTKRSPALEADEDASIRPLPPTSPPSPTPSRSSSSQISDLRTFRSVAASTKPTTLMSIDSGNGLIAGTMAHIAQAPSPNSPSSSNSNNPRFSVPLVHPAVARAASRHRSSMQAPLHTTHHPRNNPNPTAVPADNASTLTLASSAFALSARGNDWTDGISVSLDQYHGDGDVNSSHIGIDDDDAEVAASVRALRPRSSRRGSWESEESRWSARVGSGPNGVGSPSIGSGLTRPPSIGGQSTAPSLSISKLKLGVGNSDQESHKTVGLDHPAEVDAEHEELKHDASSSTIPDTLSYSPAPEGSLRDPEATSTNRASVRFSVASDEPAAASPAR
ncbi:SubName: Full=Uncharacterized protein {ECO:0000313/EMBL:CCA67226.1} [Serendipita indica DSM 11827]|nr:SubName: Full=Uncharacterized protein {ECO:0000313/EMBL:CCA67226.1} [Serendipita indica DSM 11827]